jgi:hypothetical protein
MNLGFAHFSQLSGLTRSRKTRKQGPHLSLYSLNFSPIFDASKVASAARGFDESTPLNACGCNGGYRAPYTGFTLETANYERKVNEMFLEETSRLLEKPFADKFSF